MGNINQIAKKVRYINITAVIESDAEACLTRHGKEKYETQASQDKDGRQAQRELPGCHQDTPYKNKSEQTVCPVYSLEFPPKSGVAEKAIH